MKSQFHTLLAASLCAVVLASGMTSVFAQSQRKPDQPKGPTTPFQFSEPSALKSPVDDGSVDSFIIKFRDIDLKGKGRVAAKQAEESSRASRKARIEGEALRVAAAKQGHSLKHSKAWSFGGDTASVSSSLTLADALKLAAAMKAADPSIEYVVPNTKVYTSFWPGGDDLANRQWNLMPQNCPNPSFVGPGAPGSGYGPGEGCGWIFYGGINAIDAYDYVIPRADNDPLRPFVAIIDTGYRRHVDLPLPAMGFNYWWQEPGNAGPWDPLDIGDATSVGECGNGQPTATQGSSWHGMAVQSIINGKTNNGGLASVGGPTNIGVWHTKAFHPCGSTLDIILDAMVNAVYWTNGYGQRNRVINLSLGGRLQTDGTYLNCPTPMQAVIDLANNWGVVVVAATGNEGQQSLPWPANCQGVIRVGAYHPNNNVGTGYPVKASYSNFYPYWDARYEELLLAPGGICFPGNCPNANFPNAIMVPTNDFTVGAYYSETVQGLAWPRDYGNPVNTTYRYVQGTSFAAPHVSAVAAMILSKNPSLDSATVKNYIIGYSLQAGYNPVVMPYWSARTLSAKNILQNVPGSVRGLGGGCPATGCE